MILFILVFSYSFVFTPCARIEMIGPQQEVHKTNSSTWSYIESKNLILFSEVESNLSAVFSFSTTLYYYSTTFQRQILYYIFILLL